MAAGTRAGGGQHPGDGDRRPAHPARGPDHHRDPPARRSCTPGQAERGQGEPHRAGSRRGDRERQIRGRLLAAQDGVRDSACPRRPGGSGARRGPAGHRARRGEPHLHRRRPVLAARPAAGPPQARQRHCQPGTQRPTASPAPSATASPAPSATASPAPMRLACTLNPGQTATLATVPVVATAGPAAAAPHPPRALPHRALAVGPRREHLRDHQAGHPQGCHDRHGDRLQVLDHVRHISSSVSNCPRPASRRSRRSPC